jgi:hypothetical protein
MSAQPLRSGKSELVLSELVESGLYVQCREYGRFKYVGSICQICEAKSAEIDLLIVDEIRWVKPEDWSRLIIPLNMNE